jgi:hypothetical protein
MQTINIGDLVRFREQPDQAVGVVVEVEPLLDRVGVAWSFLGGKIGWQYRNDVEVMSAAR